MTSQRLKMLFLTIPVLFCLLITVQVCAAEHSGTTDPRLQQFEHYLSENVLANVPGAAVVVVVDGKVQLLLPYGIRKEGSSAPINADTVFRLASVSKTFAAAATGLLVQDNQLHWDTTVRSRLKNVRFKDPDYGRQITVRNLLSQTTGLVPQAYTNLLEDNIPYKVIVGRLREVKFICPPGTCYSYQNVAFSLTGDIIQSVTGEPYERFVRESLFQPLGMRTASFGWQSFEATDNHATPHIWRRQQWQPVAVKKDYYNVAPAAGINASISDMQQWLLAQLGQRPDVLPLATLDQLQARTIQTTPSQAHYRRSKELGEVSYGLGWRIFDYGKYRNYVHHGGWVQGTLSEIVFNRELQLGMVFLTNSEIRNAGDMVFKFLEIYQHPNPVDRNNGLARSGENNKQPEKNYMSAHISQAGHTAAAIVNQ